MARFRLIPRDEKFYTHFLGISDELIKAARLLEEMLATEPPDWEKAEALRDSEHRCDQLTHEVYQHLHVTFVTPMDREDIHAIASSLDDVMDGIEATGGLLQLYHVERVLPGARALARMVSASVAALRVALLGLQSGEDIRTHLVEVNRLENEADRAHEQAIRQLFEDEKDPISLLKWKEILDDLEDSTDRCEDVADALVGVVLKRG